jgi:hypothetical protein
MLLGGRSNTGPGSRWADSSTIAQSGSSAASAHRPAPVVIHSGSPFCRDQAPCRSRPSPSRSLSRSLLPRSVRTMSSFTALAFRLLCGRVSISMSVSQPVGEACTSSVVSGPSETRMALAAARSSNPMAVSTGSTGPCPTNRPIPPRSRNRRGPSASPASRPSSPASPGRRCWEDAHFLPDKNSLFASGVQESFLEYF